MDRSITPIPVHRDIIIIGGGQSGLACAYYLRRSKVPFLLLDDQEQPGGAWRHTWESLTLFSPAEYSSLPGRMMPKGEDPYPARDEVLRYFESYEDRYKFDIHRPVKVRSVRKTPNNFAIDTSVGTYTAKVVISATGTWKSPKWPTYPGQDEFAGIQLHSAQYRSPHDFAGKRVLVVGGGNSGAQIYAELSQTAEATWVTLDPPTFLPDHMDGRYLFHYFTQRYQAEKEGRPLPPTGNLGDVVMVESVRKARERGVLHAVRPFERFLPDGVVWPGGDFEAIDAVIWCTGFSASLNHLRELDIFDENGKVPTHGTRSALLPELWLVGYGKWTGAASATLIGVGRSARKTATEAVEFLQG